MSAPMVGRFTVGRRGIEKLLEIATRDKSPVLIEICHLALGRPTAKRLSNNEEGTLQHRLVAAMDFEAKPELDVKAWLQEAARRECARVITEYLRVNYGVGDDDD